MPVTLRSEKGSALTFQEMDDNFLILRGLDNAIQPGTPQEGDLFRVNAEGIAVPYSPKAITVSLAADQTENITAGERVRFDEVVSTSGHIALDTVTNPGALVVPAGRYFLIATCFATFSGGGSSLASLYFIPVGGTWPDDIFGGGGNGVRPLSSSANIGADYTLQTTAEFAAQTNLELRIVTSVNVTAIGLNTTLSIFSIP